MTLKEKQSYYINLDLGYRYGELEGIYAGINTSLYATRATNHYIMLQVTGWEKAVTASIDYGFGLRCNNFEIYPYIGAGIDSFLKDKDESEADDKAGENNAGWHKAVFASTSTSIIRFSFSGLSNTITCLAKERITKKKR